MFERTIQVKIAIILGTRPEIIKMSPIIRECERRGIDHYNLHTGQPYSFEMDRVFFDDLNLPAARYNLGVGCDSRRIVEGVREMIEVSGDWANPYGDGEAAEKVIEIIS